MERLLVAWIPVLLVATGFIGVSYRYFARSQGWTIGKAFDREASWPQASVILVPVGGITAFVGHGLAASGLTLLYGLLLAFVLSITFRQWVQVIWLLLILSGVGAVAFALLPVRIS